MNDELCKLIGKTIGAIKINDAKDLIAMDYDDGQRIHLSAVGDCCSTSWFEHMTGVEALLGHTVNEVVQREMPKSSKTEDETIQYYGWTLVTERGRCDIEMRNESNGYYGGDCEVSDVAKDQYGDPRDDADSASKTVTNDF